MLKLLTVLSLLLTGCSYVFDTTGIIRDTKSIILCEKAHASTTLAAMAKQSACASRDYGACRDAEFSWASAIVNETVACN
jgi:hypothetical protein